MRIIKAIVDELPRSALQCDFGIHEWNCNLGEVVVTCELRPHEQVSMDKLSFITLRCFDCPLEEVQRWHVVKECNDVATPIDVALRKRIAELEALAEKLVYEGCVIALRFSARGGSKIDLEDWENVLDEYREICPPLSDGEE